MQQTTSVRTGLPYISRILLHITATGDIIYTSGNTRLHISEQEARELLELQLTMAKRFGAMNGNTNHAE
jgi:hypothetical protein